VDKVVCCLNSTQCGQECVPLQDISLYHLCIAADPAFQELRPACEGSNPVAPLKQDPDQSPANIARPAGNQDQPLVLSPSGRMDQDIPLVSSTN